MLSIDGVIAVCCGIVGIVVVVCVVRKILENPFHYPYFMWVFDVSGKRKVDITDYVDKFLCDECNWRSAEQHEYKIKLWKQKTEQHIDRCLLKKLRVRQYHEVLDDDHAFRFKAVRDQTRYRQKNYQKEAYKVSIQDSVASVSWVWLENRHRKLSKIGFEATLKDYHCANQRKLMTKSLRNQIMARDGYTCQICGKCMPDEIGLQIDHIVPVSKGGKTVPSNLQVLCSKCNGRKSSK